MTAIDLTPIGVIYAPHGRDATVARALLAEAGIGCCICPDLPALAEALTDEAGFAIMTIEAVRESNLAPLTMRLQGQPPWSDIPVILLTQRGGGLERNPEAARLSDALGNASFLERPFHPTTFVSVVKTAIKSRLRQFEARARIAEMREGEANLQTALLAGRLGAWELDLNSRFLQTTATCRTIFGREPGEDFTYADLIATVHPDDQARMQSAVAHTIATGEDYRIEYRINPPGKPVRWAAISARLVRDQHGVAVKMVGVSADITQRKTTEAALRDTNDLLEQRVAARTAELESAHAQRLAESEQRVRAEKLLHQAQKMEMIGQLTGGVAHDFNNLLMAVLGNLELLKKLLPDNPRAARYHKGAMEGAQRGATLTQRLLAFARQQELEVKPQDIVALVEGMADLLERSAGSRVQLQYDLDPSTPNAAVDANQVELALMNLIINARDAMPDGGRVQVKVDAIEAPQSDQIAAGAYVRLQVTDQGTGMDSATLAKAIDPFFSTKAVGKGTGLGLSMIHGLAKQLGGELRLTSKIGVGTTAELLLPITFEQAEISADQAAPSNMLNSQPLRILVVDDDSLIAMNTVDMLEDLGHVVTECNSAEEALDQLASNPQWDLVVTDYAMPRMTGLELARSIHAGLPDITVLLASGFADLPEGDIAQLPRIAKPYSQAQLRDAITIALQSR